MSLEINMPNSFYIKRNNVSIDYKKQFSIVCGLKGVGKTRFVYEYTKQITDKTTIWFDAENSDAFQNSLMTNLATNDSNQILKNLKSNNANFILVFDNIQEYKVVQQLIEYLPKVLKSSKLKIILIFKRTHLDLEYDFDLVTIKPLQVDCLMRQSYEIDSKFTEILPIFLRDKDKFPYALNNFTDNENQIRFFYSLYLISTEFVYFEIYSKFIDDKEWDMRAYIQDLESNSIITEEYIVTEDKNSCLGIKISKYIMQEIEFYINKIEKIDLLGKIIDHLFQITIELFFSTDSALKLKYLKYLENYLRKSLKYSHEAISRHLGKEFFTRLSELDLDLSYKFDKLINQFYQIDLDDVIKAKILLKVGDSYSDDSSLFEARFYYYNKALSTLKCQQLKVKEFEDKETVLSESEINKFIFNELNQINLTNSDGFVSKYQNKAEILKSDYDRISNDKDNNIYNDKYRKLYDKNHKLKMIAEGSYGSVCLVKDITDSKEKVMKRLYCREDRGVIDLNREINLFTIMLKEKKHPHIVKFFENFKQENQIYIILEYCQGKTLREKIIARDISDRKLALTWISQLVSAVQFLHNLTERYIIHRDIKPENILLHNLQIKLTDFGISRLVDVKEDGSSSFTDTVGTFSYMSPEMIKGKNYGKETDIWSIGCIVYEILTYELAFDFSQNYKQALFRVETAEYPQLNIDNKSLVELYKRMLSLNPKERPDSEKLSREMEEILKDL